MMMRLNAVLWLVFAMALGAGPARAAEPVALIMELDGDTDPMVEPFGELAPNDAISLSDGATMLFLHYPSCSEVTVQGGRLVMSAERYTLQGGRIVSVDRARCPKTVVLASSGQVGGVIIRGPASAKLGTRPEFIIAGKDVMDIAMVHVRRGEQMIAKVAMQGRNFEWPKELPNLAPAKDYVAELRDADGKVIHTLEFEVKNRGTSGVTVVRFE